MTCQHKRTEQRGIAIEPDVKEIWHGQYDVPVCYTGYESSSDVVGPSVSVNLGTRQAKARFAGEGDTAGFSTRRATVLYKAHLIRVAAVEHFLDVIVVIRVVVARINLLKQIPILCKDSLKCIFLKTIHGCHLRTTISNLMYKSRNGLCYYL